MAAFAWLAALMLRGTVVLALTGALLFTHMLGASQSANGFALAVSADGKNVAVAGSVEGALAVARAALAKPSKSVIS
jgi:hypothetical protein